MINTTARIDHLFAKEDWAQARRLIKEELRKAPDSHWLLDRLSVTYYEERKYSAALERIKKAYKLMPTCPLVLWDYAGTLDAIGQPKRALTYYLQLLDAFDKGGKDECWESTEWNEALALDCLFRIGVCAEKIAQHKMAKNMLEAFCRLQLRTKLSKLYTVDEARKLIDAIDDSASAILPTQAFRREVKKAMREFVSA